MSKTIFNILPFTEPKKPALSTDFLGSETRLQSILDLSDSFFWEQDTDFRFSNIITPSSNSEPSENIFEKFLGRRLWELEATPLDSDKTWQALQNIQNDHQPFKWLVLLISSNTAEEIYMECKGIPVFDASEVFTGYQGVIRDVTSKQRRKKLYKLEQTITRILLETKDTETTIRKAIQTLCKAQHWESGRYWHFDAFAKTLSDYDGWTEAKSSVIQDYILPESKSLALGEGLVGHVAEEGEILWIKDHKNDPITKKEPAFSHTQWNSSLLFPVNYENKLIGVLFFAGSYIAKPDSQLLDLIRSFSNHIGYMFNRNIALKQLQDSEDRYASTVYLAASGIANIDTEGYLIDFNKQLCNMLGYSRQELLGKHVNDISHPEDVEIVASKRAGIKDGNKDILKTEKRYRKKDGTPIWVSLSIASKHDTAGKHLYDIVVLEDITSRKEAEEKARYLATHDEMTSLPNRMLFGQFLSYAIESCNRYDRQFAVIFIDLDRFKIINDSMGHDAGDELICKMGERFRQCVRASDLVARLGGDEFVILMQGFKEISHVETVAQNVLAQAAKPVVIMNTECTISASVGISLYPQDATNEKELIKNADMAMYKAKEKGKNNFQFYTQELQSRLIKKIKIEACLRTALENDEFNLVYQPKVDAKTCRIAGLEVLLRWSSPELGEVSPANFIPLAEEMGVIMPIGKWVLRKAFEKIREWNINGFEPVSIAVNLSPRQFSDPELIPFISQLLDETGIDPSLIELEITETIVMTNVDSARASLVQLRELGLEISVDDFGTGYSSLAHLKRFPIHTIKIDRSFIRDIQSDPEDEAIIQAIISMAQTLGLKVVAEGVETRDQHEMLLSYGCDYLQGYYFSKPVIDDKIEKLIQIGYIKEDKETLCTA